MKKSFSGWVLLLVSAPCLIFARHMDTRDISTEKMKIQILLNSKRATGGNEGAQAAAAASLAIGTGLLFAGAFAPRYYSPPYYHHSYYGGYYGYGHGYVVSPGAAAGIAGGALLAAGAVASASMEAEREAAYQNNASIERQIAAIINGLVQTDQDYIQEAETLNASISNRGEALAAELDNQAKGELAALTAPSNQMELRLQQDLAGLEAQGLATKAYNKQLKRLNKQAVKDRKYFAKSLRSQREAVLSWRQESYNAFVNDANGQIEKLAQNYFRLYHAKLI